MGEMRQYLSSELPSFEDPVIFITSDFIPGCPMCNSSATVYYITLMERNSIPNEHNVELVDRHKFPIDIFIKYPVMKGIPQKIVIGTKRTDGKLRMIIRKIRE